MKTQTCTPIETPFSPKEELRLVRQELETPAATSIWRRTATSSTAASISSQPWKNARIICCGCSGILEFDFHSRQCYNRNQRRRLRLHRLRRDILFLPFEMIGRYNL